MEAGAFSTSKLLLLLSARLIDVSLTIGPLPSTAPGRAPAVRAAERLLSRAHKSVDGLFRAVAVLDRERRSSNASARGRSAQAESDVLRSAIIFTGAGLDATMKRLVNDVGRVLITGGATSARKNYEVFLKGEMSKPNVPDGLRTAVLSVHADEALLRYFLAERTKASFQGSSDLKYRVRGTLGIAQRDVPDARIEALDTFFVARNKIVHEMDLENPSSSSVARVPRNPADVAHRCAEVFDVAGALIRGAAAACRRAGL